VTIGFILWIQMTADSQHFDRPIQVAQPAALKITKPTYLMLYI